MWILESLHEPVVRYPLFVGSEYTVGRKDCDILIQKDSSISRKHAVLTVVFPESNVLYPEKKPSVNIKDASKFGTFVNNLRVNGQRSVTPGSMKILVKFGTLESDFTLCYEPFVITTSCLDAAKKKEVRSLVHQLGGHVSVDYTPECTMVVMSNLSVTIKVICALVNSGMVVTTDYLTEYVKSIKQNKSPPDPERYLPPLAESQIDPEEISFKNKSERKALFNGKKFFFITQKQYKKLQLAVKLAGGKPILAHNEHIQMLTKPDSIVMYSDPNEESQEASQSTSERVNHVISYLSKYGKRAIPEAEFGYAVLYCSIEKYCNPNIKVDANFFPMPSQSLSQKPEILAPNTQSQDLRKPDVSTIGADVTTTVVDETIMSTQTVIKQEPVSQVVGIIDPADQATELDPTDAVNTSTRKRPRSENQNLSPAPSAKIIKQEVKIEPASIDDLFSDDFVATTRTSRRSQRTQNVNETQQEQMDPGSVSAPESKPEAVIDDFDAIPTARSRRQRVRGKVTIDTQLTERDLNTQANGQNNNAESVVKVDTCDETQIDGTIAGNVKVEVMNTDQSEAVVDEFDMIPARRNRRQQKPDTQRPETQTQQNSIMNQKVVKIKEEEKEWKLAEAKPTSEGFLSTDPSQSSHGIHKSEEDRPDPEMRCGCVNLQFAPLIKRRINNRSHSDGEVYTRNGLPVKNFKKFKKVLPKEQIHRAAIKLTAHKDLVKQQELSRQQKEIERIQSQEQASDEQMLNDMFDEIEIPTKTTKKTSRR